MPRPPRYITLPAKAEENLLERTNLLTELLRLLHSGNQWIVLYGESGLGKTTLANTLFHEADKTNQYEQFGWIPFNLSLPKSIFEAVSDPELDVKGDKNTAFYERVAKDEIRTLKNYETLQLIVIDGVDSEQSIIEHLELLDIKRAHFIITTRQPFADTRFQNFEIPPLTDDEVLHLFSKAGLGRNILTPIELEAIGGNTWLTNLLKKHIPKTSEKAAKDFVGEVFSNLETDVQGESLAIPIAQSLFEVAPLSAAECWMLLQFAALPKGNYDLETLVAYLQPETEEELDGDDLDINPLFGFSCFEEEWLHKAESSDTRLSSQISDLVEKGWLTDFDGEYAIHDNTVQILKNEGLNRIDFLPEICNCLSVSYFTERHGRLMDNLHYESHLLGLLDFVEENSTDEYLGILWQLVKFYEDTVEYSLELEARLIHIELSEVVRDKETIANLMTDLAGNYNRLGKYESARQYAEKALQIATSVLPDTHPNIATCKGNLGIIFKQLGHYEKAQTMLEAALFKILDNFGLEHPNTVSFQTSLAEVYIYLSEYETACNLLEVALQSEIKILGSDHPRIAATQDKLAFAYRFLGQYERASALSESALSITIRIDGIDHPNTAFMQNNLANTYRELGWYEKARELFEAAFASIVKNLGRDHPEVAFPLFNLGKVFKATGDKEQSKNLFTQAYQLRLKTLGEQHPLTQEVKEWLDDV